MRNYKTLGPRTSMGEGMTLPCRSAVIKTVCSVTRCQKIWEFSDLLKDPALRGNLRFISPTMQLMTPDKKVATKSDKTQYGKENPTHIQPGISRQAISGLHYREHGGNPPVR